MVSRVLAIAGSVVADAKRQRTPYAVLVFAAVMTAAIPLLPSYGVGVVQALYREVALALTWVASLVLALALGSARVSGEIERRTVYNVLAKDVRRWEYLAGTWLGLFATVTTAVAAFTIVCQAVAMLVYGQPMFVLWEGALGIALEMGVVLAVAVAVSGRYGPMVVVSLTALVLFLAHSRGALVVEAQQPMLWKVYPSLDALVVINPVAHGSGIGPVYALTMVGVAAAWVALVLLLGAVAFEGRDL